MKRVIINADDFGLSRGINRGIIKAYQAGLLTSASLMVNMPAFEDAVGLLKENPGLKVGIHINIVRGKPILPSSKVKSLTSKGYFLKNILKVIGAIYLRRIGLKELELECRAQIEKALNRDIAITHLDSEKHIHMIKPVFEVIVKIAKEYGISKIRYINGMPYFYQNITNLSTILKGHFYKSLLLSLASIQNRSIIRKYNLKTTNYFYGSFDVNGMTTPKYERILLGLKNGTTEIMCHPGYIDKEWEDYPLCLEKFYLNVNREKELNALIDPKLKELVRKSNIELISYNEL